MNYLKLFISTLLILSTSVNSLGQTIVDPVDVPYFVIKRNSSNVYLPKRLGGKKVKGFAGIKIVVNSLGTLQSSEMEKLKLSGKINLSYQSGIDVKNDTILKFEEYFLNCISKIEIIKTDNRDPPEFSIIRFIIRF